MKNLYYATFPNGYSLIIEKFIKKQDKNAFVKAMYADAVLFFADEHFPFSNTMFFETYLVLDYQKRARDNSLYSSQHKTKFSLEHQKKIADGAVNSQIKHLLERKDLKIYFPKEVKKIRINYRSEQEQKLQINPKLRNAFETMISKLTKKRVGYFETNGELDIFVKNNGDSIFVKRITRENTEFSKFRNNYSLQPEIAFALNFLSNPCEKEVSLDPFSENGMISYVRAFSFKKANVIANEENKDNIPEIKALAKKLKEKSFSVMNYDFLSNNFPIKFIDKIVTVLPNFVSRQSAFFEKAYMLKVKKIVVLCSASTMINQLVTKFYDVKESYENLYNLLVPATFRKEQKIYVLELKKD